MIALVTRGSDNTPLAIHRTFLARDGAAKAPVDPQKMMLGPCRGGAVRLAAPGDLLMVGEGIETCLAAMQATGHPAWVALSTSGLRTLDVSAGPLECSPYRCRCRADPSRCCGPSSMCNRIMTLYWWWLGQWQYCAIVAPYPVIVLSGEQGSAKSTFSAILRALLDPNTAPLRALPREDRDLFIAASNGHVLAFDNVSGLPAWISDTLCRLATGGGFAVRQLYTDLDEVLFDAARPVTLNGIEEIVTRPDLADRAVFLMLEPIPEELRRPEQELWATFEAERPSILGVLLNAVVEGLRRLPETRLEKLPRMADFALWASACETALWPAGTFWSAYCGNRDEVVEGVIDADPVAAAVRALMTTRTVWTGNASDLLGALGKVLGERAVKSKTWPDNPRALAGRLRRGVTFLRKIGIEITFKKEGRARTRIIEIRASSPSVAPEKPGAPSSALSAPPPKSNPANGCAAQSLRTAAQAADGSGNGNVPTVLVNPFRNETGTVADGVDAKTGVAGLAPKSLTAQRPE